ncbi:transcriptional regulator [Arthrobacter sp. M2012083]|uniref:transcriptional regulator n=1 Tax=Arthrobacter sp. M2012083 TaxID=1197706 RepID=UPI0002E20D71|nr:transcriptional regulator [Arthrobacter sp. M2012083]
MSLRDAIQVSDSVLSKQLSILEKAGFVKIKKSFAGKMPRTSASVTGAGRDVWAAHLQTLREIAGGWRTASMSPYRRYDGGSHVGA